jgi:hypothetical protein
MPTPNAPSLTAYRWRAVAGISGVLLAGATGACGYSNPKPTIDVVSDTLVAYAVNGTAATSPTAFDISTETLVRVDQNLNFDIAFDVDSATGQAIVYPVVLLSNGFIGTRRVGLQRIATPFDSVTFGLRNGYRFDSSYALAPQQGLMIVTNPVTCATDPNPQLYAKIVVDSVDPGNRTIHFRATIDPNCGFRSFRPGIPSF